MGREPESSRERGRIFIFQISGYLCGWGGGSEVLLSVSMLVNAMENPQQAVLGASAMRMGKSSSKDKGRPGLW